jgi:hypothetical protein
MITLNKTNQILVGVALTALLVATRGHHFASLTNLPSASLAVFFLAGFYLRRSWVFAGLLATAALIDFSAITFGGVSSFCVTPAYALLVPAYGAVWLAGRWFATRYSFSWPALAPLATSLMTGAAPSELFSSGGFYFFGGRFADPTLVEFGARLAKYFPQVLSGYLFWIGVAAVVHIALTLANTGAKRHA